MELRVDLGFAGDQPFVNNASFGAYAAIVQSPAYRDDKIGTSLEMLPDLLTGQQGPRLVAHVGDTTLTAPQAVLVSNNPYRTGDPFGLGRRERLDSGTLGVLGVKVEGAISAAALLLNPEPAGLTVLTAPEVVIEADRDEIEAGVDGEAMVLPAPVHCRIAAGALRVRVPRKRPGAAPAPPRLDWRRLRKLAATVGRTAAPTHLHWPRHRSRNLEDHRRTTPRAARPAPEHVSCRHVRHRRRPREAWPRPMPRRPRRRAGADDVELPHGRAAWHALPPSAGRRRRAPRPEHEARQAPPHRTGSPSSGGTGHRTRRPAGRPPCLPPCARPTARGRPAGHRTAARMPARALTAPAAAVPPPRSPR